MGTTMRVETCDKERRLVAEELHRTGWLLQTRWFSVSNRARKINVCTFNIIFEFIIFLRRRRSVRVRCAMITSATNRPVRVVYRNGWPSFVNDRFRTVTILSVHAFNENKIYAVELRRQEDTRKIVRHARGPPSLRGIFSATARWPHCDGQWCALQMAALVIVPQSRSVSRFNTIIIPRQTNPSPPSPHDRAVFATVIAYVPFACRSRVSHRPETVVLC